MKVLTRRQNSAESRVYDRISIESYALRWNHTLKLHIIQKDTVPYVHDGFPRNVSKL